jgi:rhodanese-related sulfurtransferase
MEQFGTFVVRHWELFLALVVILALLAMEPLMRRLQGYRNVPALEATRLINHEDALVLDVREDQEYKEGHVLNSIHIPASRLAARIKELDKYRGRPVVTVCRTGSRSGRVCGLLRKEGFESVYNLQGGLTAWQNANLPLSRKTK